MGRVPIMQSVLAREDGVHDLSINISIDLKNSRNDQAVHNVGDLLKNHFKGGKIKFPPMLLIHFGQTFVNPPPSNQSAMKQSSSEVQCELKGHPKTVSYSMTGKESSFQFYIHPKPRNALVALQRKSQ